MFSEGKDAVGTELVRGSIFKHFWLGDSLVKIAFSDSHAGYGKVGFPYYRNKLIMLVLFAESGIFYSRTGRKSQNPNAVSGYR